MVRVFLALLLPLLPAADWVQFRGPNGNGISESTHPPLHFSPTKNVVWKTVVPFGHSSPVLSGDRIYLTGGVGGKRADAGREKVVDEGGKLFTIALDRKTGKELWRREAPRPRLERYQPTNSPASPSPVTDGENVYVFFGDYGLLAYARDGRELWRLPLGPFNNVNGHGSSPILVDGLIVLVCDSDTDSFLIAADRKTGKVRWKTSRPEVTRSYVTPVVYRPKNEAAQLIIPGSFQVTAYQVATGEKLWWVRGFSWQPKSLPVIQGDTIYVHGWEGGGDAETPTETPDFTATLTQYDANKDNKLSNEEFAADPRIQKSFFNLDLNSDGFLDERDWNYYRAKRSARNAMLAIRPAGRGDLTDSAVAWRIQKFLPNCPSPLVYQGILYLIKDGGIFTALDAASGAILKQGRLPGALDTYYASPVAAAGKVYLLSQQGKATVIRAGADWEILATHDMEDEAFATPAIVDNRLYLRTRSTLYCFGE